MTSSLQPFQFFSQDAPSSLLEAKFFGINDSGSVVYGLNLKVTTEFDVESGTTIVKKEVAEITKMELIGGQNCLYSFNDSLTLADIRTALDFYLLHDNLCCLVCYNRSSSEFTQIVVFLSKMKASILYRKTRTITNIMFDITMGFGLLPHRIALIGSQGPFDGEREIVAHLFAANPILEKVFPDEQMTPKLAKFLTFLRTKKPTYGVFANGIFFDQNAVYFLIKEEGNILKTNLLGKLTYKNEDCELINHENRMLFDGGLKLNHFLYTLQRGRNLWILMDPPNYYEMASFSWRVYHWTLPFILRTMILTLRICLWFRQLDDGWLINKYMSLLAWIFGPTFTPRLEADPVLLTYHLDLQTSVLRKAELKIPLTVGPNAWSFFNICCDVDRTGGLILCALPTKESTTVEYNYLESPVRPPTLARLATQRAYRLFPAFERSQQLRRRFGLTTVF